MNVQGAPISLGGKNFVVVLMELDLVTSHGEADMALSSLEPAFGGVPVVLMGQREDATPVYYGDEDLVGLLRDVPVDQMPWREFNV